MDVNLSGLGLRGQRRFMIRDCQIKSRALETKYDAGRAPMIKKPISADSHITEPPHCYVDYIDPKFRDRAPRIQRIDKIGDALIADGMGSPVPMGLVAAGKSKRQN